MLKKEESKLDETIADTVRVYANRVSGFSEKSMSETLKKLGLDEAHFTDILQTYLSKYHKACPEDDFDERHFPNFGELSYFNEKYPELCEALMNGGDEEFEKLICKNICIWRIYHVYS